MPVWYWEKKDLVKNSPSAKDGIDWENESKLRVEGVRLIFDVGSRMKLPYETWATGAVYFHRFYVFRSFRHYDRRVIAISCLFLAGKVEETPKKGKDLMKVVKEVIAEEEFSVFGEDPKETLITTERIVLKTIQFDLHVEHPYSILLKLLKEFKGSKEYKAPVAQMAWTFVNDSYCTTLCLQWEPDIIAAAMLYLATKMKKDFSIELINPPIGFDGKWWKIFVADLGQAVIEDVCHQQLDFISGNFGGSMSKKKKKKSSSSASSTPGPSVTPAAPSDKRKGAPATPVESSASKKMKPDETSVNMSIFPPPNFSIPPPLPPSIPPPPPSLPPPPPPPPPPYSMTTGSSIPVHSSQRGSRPRSAHSPDRDFYNEKPSNFEGQPIPALISGSNGSHVSGVQQPSSIPHNYPPFAGGAEPASPPSPSGHSSIRRSSSNSDRIPSNPYQGNVSGRRDERRPESNGRDRPPRSGSREGDYISSRDDDHRHRATSSSSKSSTSFQNNRLSNSNRYDKNIDASSKSYGGGSSSGSSGSASSMPSNRDRVSQHQQAIKPLISTSEPPPGYRNPVANGASGDVNNAVSNAGTPGMFHPSYAAAAAYGGVRPPATSPTPFENLVAAVLPRTPMQMAPQFPPGMPPITMPPPMPMRPIFSSPPYPAPGSAFSGPPPNNGLSRTPSGGHRPGFSSMPPSLLPPR